MTFCFFLTLNCLADLNYSIQNRSNILKQPLNLPPSSTLSLYTSQFLLALLIFVAVKTRKQSRRMRPNRAITRSDQVANKDEQ